MKSALYVRVSTSHQIDKDSLPFQRKELKNYSKYFLGVDDYEIFEDAGYSGKNTDRPKFQEMMSRIKAGEFSHLVVWKIDRISRNLKDFTTMYEELKGYGTTFISKNEQFDTSSAMGEAMLKIILVFAELERNLTAERVYSIMLDRASEGKWNGATVPLGYERKDKNFPVINAKEAETIKLIFNLYEKTKSTNEVKHLLEIEGLTTKKNNKWTSTSVATIIRNPFYIGTYRYNYRYRTTHKKRPEKEWIVVKDNHEAIISKEQYDKVNTIMDKNAYGRGGDRSYESHIHIFKSLIYCAKCHKKYIASTDKPRKDGYKPSLYRCYNYVHSKKQYRTCTGYLGEVKLGPFAINYIANLYLAHNLILSKKDKITCNKLEKILLKGSTFKDIAGISNISEIRDILLRSSDSWFESEPNKDELIYAVDFKKDSTLKALNNEKKKIERALNRLENLYFFDDEAINEKDYLIKKRKFEKQLTKINENIKKLTLEHSKSLPGYDLSFMKKVTKYFLSQVDISKPINYNNLVSVVNKSLLQEFIQSTLRKIVVEEDKTISSIEFINGMVHKFVYRDF